MAVIAAFVAGTMMTGTMADAAKPNNDGDGDGDIEGAVHEIVDLLNNEIFGLEEIKTEVANIETDVSAIAELQSSQFNQVITEPIINAFADNTVTCTSDRNFLVHIAGHIEDGVNLQLSLTSAGTTSRTMDGLTIIGETIGGDAGDTLTITGPSGFITLQTESGAIATCTTI